MVNVPFEFWNVDESAVRSATISGPDGTVAPDDPSTGDADDADTVEPAGGTDTPEDPAGVDAVGVLVAAGADVLVDAGDAVVDGALGDDGSADAAGAAINDRIAAVIATTPTTAIETRTRPRRSKLIGDPPTSPLPP